MGRILGRIRLSTGWRRAALCNTIAICALLVFLLGVLSWSASRIGTVYGNTIFFSGNCDQVSRTDQWLHLLLNIISAGILASSNFLMQVLTSPTRRDIDKVHKKGSSLDIGVQSISNLKHVSRRNKWLWLAFFCSSLPIHLFFNGTIFATKFLGSEWSLTVATEGFLAGAPFFPPGAYLVPSGSAASGAPKLGTNINITSYFDENSTISRSIAMASSKGQSWQRMEVPECLSEYMYCSPRQTHRDVIWIVRSHNRTLEEDGASGWTRINLFGNLPDYQASFWDAHVPANQSNALWFSASCATIANLDPRTYRAQGCSQSCSQVYGSKWDLFEMKPQEEIAANFTFDFSNERPVDHFGRIGGVEAHLLPVLKAPSATQLDLQYCLTQQLDGVCKLGISNQVLLIVVVCVLIKVLACIAMLSLDKGHNPLVVPGDAIASFIQTPDIFTKGWCTLDRLTYTDRVENAIRARAVPDPQVWHQPIRRLYSRLTLFVWARVYCFLAVITILTAILFGVANTITPLKDGQQMLSHDISNGILDVEGELADNFLLQVITINLPQLLLSCTFFIYNSLYTRLCLEKEWILHATAFRPLRVTHPQCSQRSTYRLQLPYRYSVPMIAASAILHWLVSNSLYLFILEGGYYSVYRSTNLTFGGNYDMGLKSDPGYRSGLEDNSFLTTGYSTTATLALLVAGPVLAMIPLFLGARRARSSMPPGGGNSIIISAACHSIPGSSSSISSTKHQGGLSYQSDAEEHTETQTMLTINDFGPASERSNLTIDDVEAGALLEMQSLEPLNNANAKEGLIRASQSSIRWGVIRDPNGPSSMNSGVEHLGFGTVDMYVSHPVDGVTYS